MELEYIDNFTDRWYSLPHWFCGGIVHQWKYLVFSSDGLRIRSADSLHHEIAQGMKLIELEEVYLPVLRSGDIFM